MDCIGLNRIRQADTDAELDEIKETNTTPNESNITVSDLVPVVSDHSTRQ
jgi:hypothetical protein